RIASNTKTFTAATALRLWEQELLDLEAPIAGLIDPQLDALLLARGYDTGRITVRHLLTHSAGLYDHGSDPRFTQTLFSAPERRWSREDLVRLSMSHAGPLGAPGATVLHSDIGRILLGARGPGAMLDELRWPPRSTRREIPLFRHRLHPAGRHHRADHRPVSGRSRARPAGPGSAGPGFHLVGDHGAAAGDRARPRPSV